jgi:opacity protein-like surface antigen
MRGFLVPCVGVLLLVGSVVPGHAQGMGTGTGDPYPGLFGPGPQTGSQSLNAHGNLGLSFYDVLERGPIPQGVTVGPMRGWGATGSAGLSYGLNFAGINASGSGSVYTAYYPVLGRPLRVHFRGNGRTGVSRSFQLSSRTHLGVSSAIGYRPRYLSSILPGGLGQIGDEIDSALFLDPNAALTLGHDITWGSGVSLGHELTRRVSFGGNYDYRRDWSIGPGTAGRPSLSSHSVSARLTSQLTRTLSVYGGYRYHETHYRSVNLSTFRTQMAEVGANYGRGLSFRLSRNTTLDLGGGLGGYADHHGRQRYRLTGRVVLDHSRRFWNSTVQYSRGVDSNEIFFEQPITYDRVTARVSGLITERVHVQALAFVRRSIVGFAGGDNRALQGAAMAGVQTALTAYLACSVNYVYYRYQYGSQVTIPGGVNSRYASQSVRASLNVWAPLLNRPTRSANASR